MQKTYGIRCINDPFLFWDNDCGWVHVDDAIVTKWTEEERNSCRLPIEGEWVRLS